MINFLKKTRIILISSFFVFSFFIVSNVSASYTGSLLYLWNFENDFTDVIQSNTLVYQGCSIKQWGDTYHSFVNVNAQFGKKLVCRGSDDLRWAEAHDLDYDITDKGFTYTFWHRFESGSQYYFNFYDREGNAFLSFHTHRSSSYARLYIGGNEVWYDNDYNQLGVGPGGHVFYSLSINNEYLTLYANGNLLAQIENNYHSSVWKDGGLDKWRLHTQNKIWRDNMFDDIALWNRVLSYDEMMMIYEYHSTDNAYKLPIDENFAFPSSVVLDYNLSVSYYNNTQVRTYHYSNSCRSSDMNSQKIRVDYDFCSSYGDIKQVKLGLVADDTSIFDNHYITLIKDKEFFTGSQQCSGTYEYYVELLSSCAFKTGTIYQDLQIDFYDEEEVGGVGTYLGYDPIGAYDFNLLSSSHFLKLDEPFYEDQRQLNIIGEYSYDIPFSYNFCDQENNYLIDNENIYLYFEGVIGTTTTSNFLFAEYSATSTPCASLGAEFTRSVFEGQYYNGSIWAVVIQNGEFVVSPRSKIVLDYRTEPQLEEIYSDENYGMIAGVVSFFDAYLYGMLYPLQNVFPFNFVFVLSKSWDASGVRTFDDGFLGVNFNENENLYVSLPVGDIEVFGTEFFTREARVSSFYADIRVFTSWLIFGAFFLLIYFIGKVIYAKLTDDVMPTTITAKYKEVKTMDGIKRKK